MHAVAHLDADARQRAEHLSIKHRVYVEREDAPIDTAPASQLVSLEIARKACIFVADFCYRHAIRSLDLVDAKRCCFYLHINAVRFSHVTFSLGSIGFVEAV
ncbi:MAG: hypothetical protein PHS79_05200 [Patescibacteria group bacterium]|nr:hypothetical protein [Patescibacteria group bacterium]